MQCIGVVIFVTQENMTCLDNRMKSENSGRVKVVRGQGHSCICVNLEVHSGSHVFESALLLPADNTPYKSNFSFKYNWGKVHVPYYR